MLGVVTTLGDICVVMDSEGSKWDTLVLVLQGVRLC